MIDGEQLLVAHKLNIFNNKYPKRIILLSVIIFICSIYGLTKINYNASVMEDLREGNSLYDDMVYVEKKMGGSLPLEIVLDSKNPNGILDPKILNKLHLFKQEVLKISKINKVISISDYVMLINEEIGNGLREIPSTIDEVMSFIAQYEQSNELLNEDYSKTRLSCRMPNVPYETAMSIKSQIIKKSNEIFDNDMKIDITGSTLLALSTNRHLVKSLTTSFFIAFIIIFISIVLLFKSIRLALVSILPNVIPLMIAAGIMGFVGIKLRPSTAMTFSIALGIAVDNTIHFLARFKQEYNKIHDFKLAVAETLNTSGKAILSTGLILSLGFFVLYFSEFIPNHEFGILATIIIITAVCGSLILLPVLILLIKPKIIIK